MLSISDYSRMEDDDVVCFRICLCQPPLEKSAQQTNAKQNIDNAKQIKVEFC